MFFIICHLGVAFLRPLSYFHRMRNAPERFKKARLDADIKVADMARRLNVDRKQIYRFEDTKAEYPKINTKLVEGYAKVLKKSEAELLLGYDPKLAVHMVALRIEEMAEVLDRLSDQSNELIKHKRRESIAAILESVLPELEKPTLFNE